MDSGFWALYAGVAAAVFLAAIPFGWMRAAGGLLIVVSVVLTALQLLGVL